MEFKELDYHSKINYPVGDNLIHNLPVIDHMTNCILGRTDCSKNITLWGMGSSGNIISGIIASKLSGRYPMVKICAVKKDNEKHHGSEPNPIINGIHVIVDDFVDMGYTMVKIIKAMTAHNIVPDYIVVSGGIPSEGYDRINELLIDEDTIIIARERW